MALKFTVLHSSIIHEETQKIWGDFNRAILRYDSIDQLEWNIRFLPVPCALQSFSDVGGVYKGR